jgi:hypothetical protein
MHFQLHPMASLKADAIFQKFKARLIFSGIGIIVGITIVLCFGGLPFENRSTVVMGGISGFFASIVFAGLMCKSAAAHVSEHIYRFLCEKKDKIPHNHTILLRLLGFHIGDESYLSGTFGFCASCVCFMFFMSLGLSSLHHFYLHQPLFAMKRLGPLATT